MDNWPGHAAVSEAARFIVLGTGGNFTGQVITALIGQGIVPQAYIQWAEQKPVQSPRAFGIALEVKKEPPSLVDYLHTHGVQYETRSDDLHAQIARYSPAYLLVACWPVLIAQSVIELASKAAMNVHPSLLPAYRGLDPVAEQIRQNETFFGVTLHLLSDQYDCGDIVKQSSVSVSKPVKREDLERACAIKGADLFIAALNRGWTRRKQSGF